MRSGSIYNGGLCRSCRVWLSLPATTPPLVRTRPPFMGRISTCTRLRRGLYVSMPLAVGDTSCMGLPSLLIAFLRCTLLLCSLTLPMVWLFLLV